MAQSPERAFPRYAVDAAIEIRTGAAVSGGRTTNLSRGGLCVELDRAIAPGSDVALAITLVFDDDGHSEPLVLPARAVWSTRIDDRHQVGFQFRGVDERAAAFLEMFLRYLDRGEDGDDEADEDPFA